MKRSREVTIMIDCLIESGVVSDDADTELMRRSIKEGFKRIREERFEEKLRIGGITMTNEQKKLEKSLLEFIEKESKKPSTEKSVEVIPQMAFALIQLWGMH